MSAPTHYTCPACDGTGALSTEVGCCWCDETGIIEAWELEHSDIPRTYDVRPHSPSKRRWRDPWRYVLAMQEDPLEWLARERREAAKIGDPARGYMYVKARDKVASVGAHTYAGLAQADMLARATMCESTAGRAVQAWRGAA